MNIELYWFGLGHPFRYGLTFSMMRAMVQVIDL
jgi:hypothetical protein